MKLTNLIVFTNAYIVAWISSMPKITSIYTAKNNNSGASLNPALDFDTLKNYSTNVNYLKSFDTAFIAYQMMGLSNFE